MDLTFFFVSIFLGKNDFLFIMVIFPMFEKQTGRKPSGLCGAALYMAALANGFPCSKSDVVS